MKVSVIIPVYNVLAYLQECVDCVLNQTYQDIEIILVDDGSTDGSGELCDQYSIQDTRAIVVHKENGGLSDARNVGLQTATGEYVLFMDSDDKWADKHHIERLATQAANTQADVVLFRMTRFCDEQIDSVGESFVETDFVGTSGEVMANLLYRNQWSMSACNKLIRRTLLVDNNVMFTKGLLGEDMDWIQKWWRYVLVVSYSNEAIYLYRINPNSITGNYRLKNAQDFCWILEKWQTYWEQSQHKDKHVYLGYLAYLYITLIYHYFYLSLQERNKIRYRFLQLANLLDYSLFPKSNRWYKIKRLAGKRIMLYIAALYGYSRKRQ